MLFAKIMEKWCGASLSSHKRPPNLNQKASLFPRNSLNMCLCFCNVTKFSGAEAETQSSHCGTWHRPETKPALWENTSKLKPHMVHYKQQPLQKKTHILERAHMCKPSHVEQTEAGSFSMSRNALSYGGGGAQTIPLVKQWLQNSQNVWNPKASHIFHLPKQIRSSLCVHMWKTGVLQQLLPESANTLPFFQCAFLPFSCSAQLYLYYITFYCILSFKLITERRARWKNCSANRTLHVPQTFWLCMFRKMC